MKKTSGYFAALFFGVFFGWLAQQFWSASSSMHVGAPVHQLEYNERRVQQLKLSSDSSVVSPDTPPAGVPTSELGVYVANDQYEKAVQLLNSYTTVYSGNIPYIFEIADAWVKGDRVIDALNLAYDLSLNIETNAETSYQKEVLQLVDRIEVYLESLSRTSDLVEVFRLLSSLQPEYIPFHLRLSNWLIVEGDLEAAENALISARNDIRFADEVELLEEIILDVSLRKELITIALEKVGEHYLVNVTLENTASLKLMIDTGASMTIVKEELIEPYWTDRLEGAESLVLNTANGQAQGRKLSLDNLSIEDQVLNDIEIGVLPLDGFKHDGLLGMNVLKRFDFKIDQQNNVLMLKR